MTEARMIVNIDNVVKREKYAESAQNQLYLNERCVKSTKPRVVSIQQHVLSAIELAVYACTAILRESKGANCVSLV